MYIICIFKIIYRHEWAILTFLHRVHSCCGLATYQTTAFPVLGKFFPHLISICFKHSPINKVHYRIIRNINIKFIQIVELLLFLNTFSF